MSDIDALGLYLDVLFMLFKAFYVDYRLCPLYTLTESTSLLILLYKGWLNPLFNDLSKLTPPTAFVGCILTNPDLPTSLVLEKPLYGIYWLDGLLTKSDLF